MTQIKQIKMPFVLLSLLVAAACSQTPEQQVVSKLTDALGGRDKINAAHSLDMQGEGVQFNLGQDMKPELASQQFKISSFHRIVDLTQTRTRTGQVRTPAKFLYFQGQQATTQVFGLDGEIGYNATAQGATQRIAAAATRDRLADMYSHPLVLARALLQPSAKIANVREAGGTTSADVTTPDGVPLGVTLDGAGLPTKIDWQTYHPNLGDVTISTAFSGYQDAAGLKLPTKITTRVDDFTTAEITIARLAATEKAADIAALSDSPPAPVPPAPNVTVEPIGKGAWFLAGGSHHSVLVEFADHLTLIDAPQSEARALAVIARARETVPGKPLTTLAITHHHFDHTAGMRAAISEGLSIVTQAGNKDWVERMAKRPHTRQPDALQKNAKPVKVDSVDSELTMKDAANEMTLYHVAGNPHSDTMLMAYLPAQKVLVEVDAFTPGGTVQPYAANLLENITSRKLKVDRIVPLHGAIAKFEELPKAVPKS
jgi:glyoxylase-like metal-dependent hydrolase (beta-lactamase superfamily II)